MKYKNSRKQGDWGLGAAISWFCEQGLTVSIPLTDSQEYDLVVDSLDGLEKVQVKTSTYKPRNYFKVQLSVKGGNKSCNKVKFFDPSLVDSVFILTRDGDRFWIPSSLIHVKDQLTLTSKWDNFRV